MEDMWTEATAPAQTPIPDAAAHQPDQAGTPVAPGRTRWHVAGVALVGLLAGGVSIMLTMPGRQSSEAASGSSSSLTTGAPIHRSLHSTSTSTVPESSLRPKWIQTRASRWASDGSKTISFELEAEREVGVWMKRVRPTLTVRCLGREMEVFVVTDSAASIEPTADQHTVHISFDDQAETSHYWLDSADHRELFAPDGMALARQIAGARTMRFGFTPFNSQPVVVDFDVRGFGGPLESVSKTCRSAPKRGRA
jgi:hypothetical protein